MPVEYTCKACAYVTMIYARSGKCPSCGTGTIIPSTSYRYWLRHRDDKPKAAAVSKPSARVGSVDSFADESTDRIKIGWKQLDYFFGGAEGGIQKGAVYRLTGLPGCGKSTLLAQIAAATGAMYCCSEESGPRVATRMRRLGLTGLDKVHLVIGASMARAKRHIEERRPKLIIVDSLQTFQYISEEAEEDVDAVDLKANENHDDAVTIAIDFIKWAQKTKSAVILVNHLNKEGQAAGKIKIDYLIDGNFDLKGDQNSFLRLLTATKNRTSATAGVVASFWMTKRGLIDVPKGDAAEALERLIAEGVIDPPLEQLEKEENEPERTFDQFEKEADAVPREKPTKSRRSARHAP